MRSHFIYLFVTLFICTGAIAQNVGVGTATSPARLTIQGDYSSPSIPGSTSTGVLRVGVGTDNIDGIDIGKSQTPPYSGWMQAGFNSIFSDPLSLQPLGGSVGIGTIAPHTSAALDVTSTTQGFLPPRITKAQRDAIATPAEGLVISCTDCSVKGLHQYINGAWQALTSSNTGNYGTVVNPITGKVWLDRNLGATQVATSSSDAASYGDLYQWGRNADGHQIRTSGTTGTQASDFFTNNGLFIIGYDNWLSGATPPTHMWSGTGAENNPCPSGFRIPTAAEWEQERRTWSSHNTAGAFASTLKLPAAGFRYGSGGSLTGVGYRAYYWSSSVSGAYARGFFLDSISAFLDSGLQADGFSVRCIKD